MKILVTAGPTREFLDPVRFLSNPSTGKMGYAVARAARRRGHHVVLVSGPTHVVPPKGVQTVRVLSAQEMFREVRRRVRGCDGVVMTAAVSDYQPRHRAAQKLKKAGKKRWRLELQATPDILAHLGRHKGNRWLVGFAAETQNLVSNARKKLVAKNLDWIVANDVRQPGAGFGSDTNRVVVLNKKGNIFKLPKMSKLQLARWLLGKVEQDL